MPSATPPGGIWTRAASGLQRGGVEGGRDKFGTPEQLEPFVAALPHATLQPAERAGPRAAGREPYVILQG